MGKFSEIIKRLKEDDPAYTEVDISGIELGKEEVAKLADALKTNHTITSLNLQETNLDNEGIRLLVEATWEKSSCKNLIDVKLDEPAEGAPPNNNPQISKYPSKYRDFGNALEAFCLANRKKADELFETIEESYGKSTPLSQQDLRIIALRLPSIIAVASEFASEERISGALRYAQRQAFANKLPMPVPECYENVTDGTTPPGPSIIDVALEKILRNPPDDGKGRRGGGRS